MNAYESITSEMKNSMTKLRRQDNFALQQFYSHTCFLRITFLLFIDV